ncbi:hypothetical protein ACFSKL_05655 [Belliella marina]|uniref:Tetratricopeptide repeat-containing protein n=1 Tax=Belliella marina TaxID=1644146 RepID=A0ABW4VIV7_9BACT
MKNNMEELIEKYLNNQLSEEEKSDFENQLEKDPELKADLEFRHQIKIASTLNERKRLKEILHKKSQEARKPRWRSWKMAAALAVLLSLTWIGYWLTSQYSQQNDLFLAHYETFPNLEMPSIRGGSMDRSLSEAFLAYENEDYQIAKDLLLQDYEGSGNMVSKYYAAMAAMELKEYDIAYSLLESIDQNIPDIYKTPRDWYLGLLLLKGKDNENAKSKIEKVAKTEHVLAGKASELFDKIP